MTEYSLAQEADATEILALQKLAYRREAERYGDWTLPPLVQTLEEMERDLRDKTVLKTVQDGRIVGSVRGHCVDGTCYVARLVVQPDRQRQGIGSELLRRIEDEFPDARRFELFTGHRSDGPLRLYARAGYREFRREVVGEDLTLVYLEKRVFLPG